MTLSLVDPAAVAVPIRPVDASTWPRVRAQLSAAASEYARSLDFTPLPGRWLVVPGADGRPEAVLFGAGDANDTAAFETGRLATALPPGVYRFDKGFSNEALASLAFHLGLYRFKKFRDASMQQPQLVFGKGVDGAHVERVVAAVSFGRNLINTPANVLGPAALAKAALDLGEVHGAHVETIVGDDLLERNFPLIHAVGRAGHEAPRLVDLRWSGADDGPRIVLVGKGVTFDTGGLDIKPSAGMLIMKKDMGGAATALSLASMIMDAKLPVSLRVLLPIVENAIASDAFRPGDVFRSRKGLTVEIGNTDAEGRLILADALAYADEEETDLLVDFATLTGAARVALGPDLPALFTPHDELADEMLLQGRQSADPVWRLPLWAPYGSMLDSRVADLNNVAAGSYAGAVVAALFLQRFVSRAKNWAHLDIFAWTPSPKPGRPEGGEIQTARMLFDLLRKRYPAKALPTRKAAAGRKAASERKEASGRKITARKRRA